MEQLAQKHSIKIEKETLSKQTKENTAFIHLDQHFDSRPAVPYEKKAPIRMAEAVHPRAEVEGVAQEIIKLVRDENYRYRDIAILLREPDVYHDLITTVFDDYQIPIFVDEKRTMLHHPLIECLRSLLDLIEGDWRYDAVFRVLKTGLIPEGKEQPRLDQEAIDELENYVLEYGIRGKNRWTNDQPWVFQRFKGFDESAQTDREMAIQERINAYRMQVVDALAPIDQALKEAKTIEQKAIVLYQWLEEMQIPKHLEKIREQYDEEGLVEKGREQDQVWDAVIQLLEEITEIAGQEETDLKLFRSILESGFESLQFSHVPPSLDHVVVGSIDRSRMQGVKCALLLGVNEGTWPMKQSSDGIITEEERALLQDNGFQLAEGSKRQLLDDWFYVYLAFTLPEDYLWISYPISNSEGKAKVASSLIKRMEELFPQQWDKILLQDPEEMTDARRFVTTPRKTRGALTSQLARQLRGYPIDPIWQNVLNWYIENIEDKLTNQRVLRGLFYQNKPTNLSSTTVEKMYPEKNKGECL